MNTTALMHEGMEVACVPVCNAESDKAAWLAARAGTIGASETPALFGLNPHLDPVGLWLIKTGRKEYPNIDDREEVEAGRDFEPYVVAKFARKSGKAADRSTWLYRSLEHPWMSATPDGFFQDAEGWGVVEAKWVGSHNEWRWVDGAPMRYVIQLHQQMIVTGARRGVIAAYFGGQRFVWQPFELDDKIARSIVEQGTNLHNHIQADIPPQPLPGGQKFVSDWLREEYAKAEDKRVMLDARFEGYGQQLRIWGEERRQLDEKIKTLENEVKMAVGNARYGVLPSGDTFNVAPVRMPEKIMPACEYKRVFFSQAKVRKG